MPIPQRHLGKNGPLVSAIGLGAMGMSEFYGAADEEESLATLNAAIDAGCTFIDTADMYGRGANERLLAKVLATRRDEVFVCTKFGVVRNEQGAFVGVNGDPAYLKSACERSLERLGISTIDLYYQHRVDPTVDIEKTVGAMAELVREGKVKYLGLSECSGQTLRRAYKVHPIHAVQVEYSPWSLDIETNGLLEACRELGVAIVAYSPLGRGFLTGRFKSPDDFEENDYRKHNPRFLGDNFKKNLQLVEAFEKFAAKKGYNSSQLALAWVMAQGDDFIPIPGTKRRTYLEENLKSVDIKLSDEELSEIRKILSEFEVAGTRYPEQGMKGVNL